MNDPFRTMYTCSKCHVLPCECVRVHQPLTLVSIQCSICKTGFLTETDMSNHRIAHHEKSIPGIDIAKQNGQLIKE